MADLHLEEATLSSAARTLTDISLLLRRENSLFTLRTETYTSIEVTVSDFMRSMSVAVEALSDAAGDAAGAVVNLMGASEQVEAELGRALGPGFVG